MRYGANDGHLMDGGAIGCFTINSLHLMFTFFIWRFLADFQRLFVRRRQRWRSQLSFAYTHNNQMENSFVITMWLNGAICIYELIARCLLFGCRCCCGEKASTILPPPLPLPLPSPLSEQNFIHIIMSVLYFWIVSSNCCLWRWNASEIEFHRSVLCERLLLRWNCLDLQTLAHPM